MVVEIRGRTCIVLTPQGEFRKVALPSRGVRLGEEIALSPVKAAAGIWRRPFFAAACVFLLLFAGFLYYDYNAAVAYVGLDINPSVELGVNRRERVCRTSGLDAEGKALLKKVSVFGLPVEQAIEALVAGAVSARYIEPARENVIFTTVTATKGERSRDLLDEQQIAQSIEKALRMSGVRAEVVVEEAPPEVRRQARQAGLSTGKYLLQLRAAQKALPGSRAGESGKGAVSDAEPQERPLDQDLKKPVPGTQGEAGRTKTGAPQEPPGGLKGHPENRGKGTPAGGGENNEKVRGIRETKAKDEITEGEKNAPSPFQRDEPGGPGLDGPGQGEQKERYNAREEMEMGKEAEIETEKATKTETEKAKGKEKEKGEDGRQPISFRNSFNLFSVY